MNTIKFAGLALLCALPLAAQGGMYKWVDEKGVTHYGDAVPPQYAGQGNTELNKRGVPMKKTAAAATAEQIQQRAIQQEFQRQQDQLKLVQRRKDMALLNTYTSAEEIDLARDRHVGQAELVIRATETRLALAEARHLDLRKQLDALRRNGKPVSPAMEKNFRQSESEVQGLRNIIAQKRTESQAIRSRFDADKKRFSELSQAAAAGPQLR